MYKLLLLMVISLFFSCNSKSPNLYDQKVDFPFYSQNLLRNLVVYLDEQSEFNITLSPRLSKVIDLTVDKFPRGLNEDDKSLQLYDNHQSNLIDHLDYICNFVSTVHKVEIGWRVSGSNIELIFLGSEEEYADLRKLD